MKCEDCGTKLKLLNILMYSEGYRCKIMKCTECGTTRNIYFISSSNIGEVVWCK